MLGNPERIRSETMTIRFSRRERAVIEWMAEQTGVAPAFLVYELFTEGARQRLLQASQQEAEQGSRA